MRTRRRQTNMHMKRKRRMKGKRTKGLKRKRRTLSGNRRQQTKRRKPLKGGMEAEEAEERTSLREGSSSDKSDGRGCFSSCFGKRTQGKKKEKKKKKRLDEKRLDDLIKKGCSLDDLIKKGCSVDEAFRMLMLNTGRVITPEQIKRDEAEAKQQDIKWREYRRGFSPEGDDFYSSYVKFPPNAVEKYAVEAARSMYPSQEE